MGIELGNDFAPTWAGRPPGISPEDYDIWKVWRPRNFKRFDKLNFNVRLFRPLTLDPGLPENIKRMAEFNAAKRIDVLGWCAGAASIIELRNNAGLSAIGQLLGYNKLFRKEFPDMSQVKMILVSNRFDPDVSETAESLNIDVEQV